MDVSSLISSQSPYALPAAGFFATICLYFGLNGLLRPQNALEVFEFDYPKDPQTRILIDGLMRLYGIRDTFMALAIYIAAYLEHRDMAGWLLILVFGVAVADGMVNKAVIGRGEWTHWGYAPMVGGVGAILVGAFDRT